MSCIVSQWSNFCIITGSTRGIFTRLISGFKPGLDWRTLDLLFKHGDWSAWLHYSSTGVSGGASFCTGPTVTVSASHSTWNMIINVVVQLGDMQCLHKLIQGKTFLDIRRNVIKFNLHKFIFLYVMIYLQFVC